MVSEKNAKKREEMAATAAIQATKPAFEKIAEGQVHLEKSIDELHEKTEKWATAIDERQKAVEEYLTSQEKAALYKLNTPVDIADMEEYEKRLLLAVLYQLSANEEPTTPEQQNYLRAVQQHLKIYNPQTVIDLGAVENIDSSSDAQAILQTVLEFFYLGADFEQTLEKYDDFLCCFPVSRITEKRVHRNIEAIIEGVGVQGLAEKYGIVAEQPRSEFATYNDNGRIPEKVADLCLTYIDKGCNQFQNDEYVLETDDYLVLCKKTPSWDSWETLEIDKKLDDNGFFCIEKRSGKVTRIAIDYKKDFPFSSVENLSFCIQGNTVYFIENGVDREKYSEVHLVSIDFAKKEFQLQPFKFSISTYNVPVRFHISCSRAYVMIYAYLLADLNYSYQKDATRPLSKIFVMDQAQGNRIFTIEPDLIVRDALIHENQFFVLGTTKHNTHTGVRHNSIFRYDVASKKCEDIFPEYQDLRGGAMVRMAVRDFWVDRYNENYLIEKIHRTENKWFFVIREEEREYGSKVSIERYLKYPRFNDDKDLVFLKKVFWLYKRTAPVIFNDGEAITWNYFDDEHNFCVERYDLTTEKNTFMDSHADIFVLLGDYLYKRIGSDWYKTNISQGWDSLQWEYVTA